MNDYPNMPQDNAFFRGFCNAAEVYLTKYALSSGVRKILAKRCVVSGTEYFNFNGLLRKEDCQETEDDAIARIEFQIERRRKAIANELRKLDQIKAKLAQGELPMDPKYKGGEA